MKATTALFSVLLLAGCCSPAPFGFNESKLSAKAKKGIDVWVLSSSSDAQDANARGDYQRLLAFAQYDDALRKSLNGSNTCNLNIKGAFDITPQIGPAAIPIILAVTSLAVDIYAKHESNKLDDLKEAALQKSDIEFVVPPAQLKAGGCIVVSRTSTADEAKTKLSDGSVVDAPRPGLLAVLLIEMPASDYFTLRPVFLRARNSIATTSKESGEVAVTTAVAVKQVAVDKGVATLAEIGQGATTVNAIELAEGARCIDADKDKDNCVRTNAVPVPTGAGSVVIGLSVTEVGNVGFKIERRQAEIEAIRSALGPAAAATVQGRFDREAKK